MWHISYYDYAVSFTTSYVQLYTYAANSMAKFVHPNAVAKIKN